MNRESVQSAQSGWIGFDTDTTLTASTAAAFVTAGFRFAVRYLSLGSTESAGDLTATEVQTILSAGLALSAVQHVPKSGWQPTQQLGTQYGQNAAKNAHSVGLPAGMVVWLDLEGIASDVSAANVSSYCNAWFSAVSSASYVPGLYVGYNSILDADQLDALNVKYFWMSGSSVPYPATGYCMVQSINSSYVLDGVSYDRDAVQNDNLGQTPTLLAQGEFPLLSRLEEKIPAFAGVAPSTSGSSRFPWAGSVLAGLLAYAAGVYTGPMILPGTGHATTSQAPSHTEKPAAAKTTAAPAHSKPTEPAKPAAAKAPEPAAQPPKPVPETAPPPTPEKAPAPAADRKSPKLDAEQLLLVGSFSQGGNADRLAQSLEKAGYGRPEVTETTARGRVWHVVRLGPFRNRADADRVAGQLKQKYDLLASVRPRPGE